MRVTEPQAQRIVRIASRVLREYRSFGQYDDLHAYAVLNVCWVLRKFDDAYAEKLFTRQGFVFLVKILTGAIKAFFQSQQCDLCFRHTSQRGYPIPRPLSLDEVAAAQESEDFWFRDNSANKSAAAARFLPVTPDFVPELIERLWREEVVREVWETLNAEEREIARKYLNGMRFEDVGASLGITKEKAQRLFQVGLNNYREPRGIPLRKDGKRRYSPTETEETRAERRKKWAEEARARLKKRKERQRTNAGG